MSASGIKTELNRKREKKVRGHKIESRIEDLKKEVTGQHLENQIKNILAMGGGISQSVKAFKAIFAILQSITPNEFPLQWDVIFFSVYSRKLRSELSRLILEKGEVEEVLWRQKGSCHPFHHIYILTQKAERSIKVPFYKKYEKPYYSDFIAWSLLEPKFPIYWSYFLEMYTFQAMPENGKQMPFLDLLENELRKEKDKAKKIYLQELQKMRDKLCKRLSELRISRLETIKPSYSEKNNLYIFLPFRMDKKRREKFLNFYMSGRHNGYVNIQECKNKPNLFNLKIDPDGVTDIYSYINLTKEEIKKELSRFDVNIEQFGQLVDYYTHQIYKRLPKDNEDSYSAYYRIVDAANNRREFLNNIPEPLKHRVIERAKELLWTLDKFYELAQWRYNSVINMLVKLARVSQRIPINLFFDTVDLRGYLNDTCVNEQTMIGFEFSDEFRRGYKKEFGYKMPSSSLHHVCHFVQPEEALKAICNRKENCLLEGGPVIGEY